MSGATSFVRIVALMVALTRSMDGNAADTGSRCSLVVTTTADAGPGSLWEAIECSNSNPGVDTILFAVPGVGPHLIQLETRLPYLTDTVVVDGFSQAGSRRNTSRSVSTDASLQVELRGTTLIPDGFRLMAPDCVIQGLAINGFSFAAVRALSDRNSIRGNFIGVDAAGLVARPNGHTGILVGDASDNVIGGPAPEDRNVISGNHGPGICLKSSAVKLSSGTRIFGNVVGLGTSGTSVPNDMGLQLDEAVDTIVGGTGPGQGNFISGNTGAGVAVFAGGNAAIVGNSIYGNGGLGIDLQPRPGSGIGDGVTPNDALDLDHGPNTLQNFPVLTAAVSTIGETSLSGSLDSESDRASFIDFYANTECDPSGYGEGKTYLGRAQVVTDVAGHASFSFKVSPPLPIGTFITSTTTSIDGRTSEFSACHLVTALGGIPALGVGITASPDPVTVGTPLTYTISVTNLGPGSIDLVTLANSLPPGLTNVEILVGGNSCVIAGGKVTCEFGTLTEGQVIQVVIRGTPTVTGVMVDSVTVTGKSGENTITGTGSVETTVVPIPSEGLHARLTGEMRFNRQTGLFEQSLQVWNDGTIDKNRVRVFLEKLPSGSSLYNATDLAGGVPFVQLPGKISPGITNTLLLEFYVIPRRALSNLVTRVEVGLPLIPQRPTGTPVTLSKDKTTLRDGRILIEFDCIPGRTYEVQYSDDNLKTWKSANPTVVPPANRFQWIDDGPPKTDATPQDQKMRVYRVFVLP